MSYKFAPEDLTREKSLWDIYVLSRRILPSKAQVILVVSTIVFLASNAFFLEEEAYRILQDTRKWAQLGFSFSITTLGFLTAGFTIFATLSKPKMLLAMMDHTHPGTGLPTLKYNFFAFMKVFIAYLGFTGVYLFILIFGQPNGFLSNLSDAIAFDFCDKIILFNTAYVIVGASFIYLLLLLQTFIFNIYAIVMNFLRWEYYEK